MEFIKLLHFFTFLSLSVVASHADLNVYWKFKLPNTPMPKAVLDILHDELLEDESTTVFGGKGGGVTLSHLTVKPDAVPFKFRYRSYATEDQLHDIRNLAIFFLKKDLHRGTIMNLQFVKSANTAAFLPRQVADSIPFSSKHVPEILKKLSLKPESVDAEIIKKTIKECEEPGIKGEEKYCATSLESMVDFSMSKLGKNVKAVSTEAKLDTKSQKYGIVEFQKLNMNGKAVVCHKQNYAYAVFYCHTTQSIEAYTVSLVGANGAKANAVAICHKDTAEWNPKNLAFQVLKVKPGTVPICHFLPEDHIVWVTK